MFFLLFCATSVLYMSIHYMALDTYSNILNHTYVQESHTKSEYYVYFLAPYTHRIVEPHTKSLSSCAKRNFQYVFYI
jgi:hypothetical protein